LKKKKTTDDAERAASTGTKIKNEPESASLETKKGLIRFGGHPGKRGCVNGIKKAEKLRKKRKQKAGRPQ